MPGAEGFRTLKVDMPIFLHPSRFENPKEGAREYLNNMLMRYNEDLDGVVVSYHQLVLKESSAAIFPMEPHVRLVARVNLVVFKPQVGQHLVGTVNVVADDSISLLVHGVFNAFIGTKGITANWQFDDGAWRLKDDSSVCMEVDSRVRFSVYKVRMFHGFLSIGGALDEEGKLGPVAPGQEQAEEGLDASEAVKEATTAKKKKKRKRADDDSSTSSIKSVKKSQKVQVQIEATGIKP